MNDFIRPRPYYAARKNGSRGTNLRLEDMRELVKSAWDYYEHAGYFVEAFGFTCVDSGFDPGYAGTNVQAYALLSLQRANIWPFDETYEAWDEDDAFTVIEFLYDHISKPHEKSYHSWDNCGYHYSNFDKAAGQVEYRERINVILAGYGDGWELTEKGEVLSKPPQGMATLLDAPLPTKDQTAIQRVADATIKFRRHGSSKGDRRDAVRNLADVLEWLRPQIKAALLREDEQELFNIANNFGIRHLNQNQKLHYDESVWLSWMFYHYLNTINAFLHILKRQQSKQAISA